jgi:LPS O-antigen subunit length determinant protein (WzzB/FepE family)
MANNLNRSKYFEDEIDLREIIKILIESKKLIISSILIFTIASIIYSLSIKPSFNTSAKLEIGYVEINNGDRELIESATDFISNLKVLIMKNPDGKFSQDVSMNSFEGKVVNLKTTSGSAEQNENLLTEMINYIDERHSKLSIISSNLRKKTLVDEIDSIKSEISYLKNKLSYEIDSINTQISYLKENMRVDLESKILKLQSSVPLLDQEITQINQVLIEDSNNLNSLKGTNLSIQRAANSPTLEQVISTYKSVINKLTRERNNSILDISIMSKKLDALKNNTLRSENLFKLEERKKDLENYASQSDELFSLEQERKILENQLQTLMNEAQVKTHLIGNIETKTIKPKTQLTILLGLIIGFIMSIFLVFINNFIKNFRESEA